MLNRVYFDTWLLAGLVAKKSSERSDMKAMLSKMTHGYEVVVPQVALGEVFAIVMKKNENKADVQKRLVDLCDDLYKVANPKTGFPPPTTEIFQFARDLTAGDSQIKNMDALIASHALTDPKSTRLITADKNLLNSTAVRKIESDLRDDGKREVELRIADGLGH